VLEAWDRDTRTAGTNVRSGAQCEVVKIEGAKGRTSRSI
jgi:hypothetical protein